MFMKAYPTVSQEMKKGKETQETVFLVSSSLACEILRSVILSGTFSPLSGRERTVDGAQTVRVMVLGAGNLLLADI